MLRSLPGPTAVLRSAAISAAIPATLSATVRPSLASFALPVIIARSMPIYEYRCSNGHDFEVFQAMADDPVEVCEVCGSPVQRVFQPGRGPLQGLGLLHDRLREEGPSKASSSSDGGSSKLGFEVRLRLEVGLQVLERREQVLELQLVRHHLALRAVRLARRLGTEQRLGGASRTRPARPRGCRQRSLPTASGSSVPPPPPITAEKASWGIVSPPMLETIVFGASQPISGPLMKFKGRLVMLVSLPLIPSRISCWNWARSTSVPENWPEPHRPPRGCGRG